MTDPAALLSPEHIRLIDEAAAQTWAALAEIGVAEPEARPPVASPADLLAGGIARLIDHTLLKPEATPAEIHTLCEEAEAHQFASVCINSSYVSLCASLLRGSGVAVCTVVGFPLGAALTEAKWAEAQRAIELGAAEVDMVLHIGALKSGDLKTLFRDIDVVVDGCRAAGALSKVIIETSKLTEAEKVTACIAAKAAGADFVKTSTGFGGGGATPADIALMRRAVGADRGVKASGGVRGYDDARALVLAGATRIGASAGVAIVAGEKGAGAGPTSEGY